MLPSLPFKENFTSGRQLIPGQRINSLTNLLTSYQALIPIAGNAASGPFINAAFVDLATVNANDGVTLPAAKVGLSINITNDGAAAASIWPSGVDVINAVAAGGAISLAAGANALFICVKDGFWRRYVSA